MLEFSKSQHRTSSTTSSTLEILDADYRSAIRRIRDTLAKYYFVGDPPPSYPAVRVNKDYARRAQNTRLRYLKRLLMR